MKVLLIKAPYRDVYGPIKLAAGNYFLLGLGYIASYLRNQGHEVSMLDPEAEGLNFSKSVERIKAQRPDLVGISATTPDFPSALRIAQAVRRNTSAFLLLGGIHATSLPEYILTKYKGTFDAICVGEGEETSSEVCQFLQGTINSLEEIDGLVFAKNGQLIRTKPRKLTEDLDRLPFPARDLVDIDLYKPHAFNTRRGRTATIVTSRGCPFRCTFCASKLISGGRFRARSAENVLEEVKYLVEVYNVKHILIQDDTFTFDKERAKDICRKIVQAKLKIEWFSFSQVTKVDEELLGLMKRAGCYCIGFGIESADEGVLKSIRKPITAQACEYAIALAKRHGLKTQAFFIFGNKTDTKETIEKTIEFACKTSPTLAFFNKLVAYPGTQIFKEYFGHDYEGINWKDFVPMGVNATTSTNKLSKRQLQRLVYKANLKFYFRPPQLWEILKSIKSLYELKAYLRGGLGLVLQMIKWNR